MTPAPANDVQPFVSVVVPVRDGEATIDRCISAILGQDYPEDRREVLVVDNGSTDATAAIARARPVTCLSEPEPGVSNARNRGIEASRSSIVALLDADCIPERGWLAALVAPFADPEVGCVAGELRHARSETAAQRQAERMLGNWQRFATSSNPPFVVTANAAFRREVFDRIGLFDPRMTRAQDVELSLRFNRLSSLRVAYCPEAIARHHHPQTLRGFLRQQLGWAYGAGLVEAKGRATGGPTGTGPRLRPIGDQLRGLAAVLRLRARGNGRPEYLEDAWYSLLRQLAWWCGGWAGLIRGRRRFS